MSMLASFGGKMVGFFIDDAFLGFGIAAAVLAAALCRAMLGGRPLLAGALLCGGCLLALTLSIARAAGRPAVIPRGN